VIPKGKLSALIFLILDLIRYLQWTGLVEEEEEGKITRSIVSKLIRGGRGYTLDRFVSKVAIEWVVDFVALDCKPRKSDSRLRGLRGARGVKNGVKEWNGSLKTLRRMRAGSVRFRYQYKASH
jgi:hypothetical protein